MIVDRINASHFIHIIKNDKIGINKNTALSIMDRSQ